MQTAATFRLSGHDGLTAAAVTQRLGLRPSEAFEAGTPVGRRPGNTRSSSLWLLASSPGIESDVELVEHLHRLLTIVEPVAEALWELVNEGYQANWYCWVASHPLEHAVELDRPTLGRLLALPGDLWLDVCGDDTDHE